MVEDGRRGEVSAAPAIRRDRLKSVLPQAQATCNPSACRGPQKRSQAQTKCKLSANQVRAKGPQSNPKRKPSAKHVPAEGPRRPRAQTKCKPSGCKGASSSQVAAAPPPLVLFFSGGAGAAASVNFVFRGAPTRPPALYVFCSRAGAGAAAGLIFHVISCVSPPWGSAGVIDKIYHAPLVSRARASLFLHTRPTHTDPDTRHTHAPHI